MTWGPFALQGVRAAMRKLRRGATALALLLAVLVVHVAGRAILSQWYESDSGLFLDSGHGYYSDGPFPFERIVDWLAFGVGYITALLLLPAAVMTIPARFRRLLVLGAVALIVFFAIRSALSLAYIRRSWGADFPAQDGMPPIASDLLRLSATPVLVVFVAFTAALVHATYRGSAGPALDWLRGRALVPSAVFGAAFFVAVADSADRGRILTLVVATMALVSFIVLCVSVLPQRLVAQRSQRLGHVSSEDRGKTLEAENDIRTSLLQAASGVILTAGVVFTFLQLTGAQESTQRQLELTLAGQTADRFARAVDQLDAGKSIDVQLGAIYSLDKLADESPEYGPAISGTLSAYVTTRRPLALADANQPRVRVDRLPHVQSALRVLLQERDQQLTVQVPDTDLYGAAMRGGVLTSADLSGSSLQSVDLQDARFDSVDARGVNFRDANLRDVEMLGVDLRETVFSGASTLGMTITLANLSGADASSLSGETLTNWIFGDAKTKWPRDYDSEGVPSGDCSVAPEPTDDLPAPPGCE